MKKRKKNWNPIRFPRLETDRKTLIAGIRNLKTAWKQICISRGYQISFDTETDFARRARHFFPIIVNMLIQNYIHPIRFLKVMSQYGRFGKKQSMPAPAILASKKNIETFRWMNKKVQDVEIRKQVKQEWEEIIRSKKNRSSVETIVKEIRSSKIIVSKIKESLQVSKLVASFIQADRLSPWYFAISKEFLRSNGLDVVDEDTKEQILESIKYLTSNRKILREIQKRVL